MEDMEHMSKTQDSKTTKQEMMEEQSTLTEDKAKSQIHTSQITKQKMVEQFQLQYRLFKMLF